MANMTYNKLTVYGPADQVSRFENEVAGAYSTGEPLALDFNQHVPMPELSTFGQSGSWAYRSWGTKALPDVSETSRPVPGGLVYEFETAWSPPLRWLRYMGDLFPKLSFEIHYQIEDDEPLWRAVRVQGSEELGGYALINPGSFDWSACERAINDVVSGRLTVMALTEVGAEPDAVAAIDLLQDSLWDDGVAGEPEIERAVAVLCKQLERDLRTVKRELEDAIPATVPYRSGTATSYLIGSRAEAEWLPEREEIENNIADLEEAGNLKEASDSGDLDHRGGEAGLLDPVFIYESSLSLVEQTIPEVGAAVSRLAACDVLEHAWSD